MFTKKVLEISCIFKVFECSLNVHDVRITVHPDIVCIYYVQYIHIHTYICMYALCRVCTSTPPSIPNETRSYTNSRIHSFLQYQSFSDSLARHETRTGNCHVFFFTLFPGLPLGLSGFVFCFKQIQTTRYRQNPKKSPGYPMRVGKEACALRTSLSLLHTLYYTMYTLLYIVHCGIARINIFLTKRSLYNNTLEFSMGLRWITSWYRRNNENQHGESLSWGRRRRLSSIFYSIDFYGLMCLHTYMLMGYTFNKVILT